MSIKIGNETIHYEQVKAGVEIVNHFENGDRCVLLKAQFQAGKTGTGIWVANYLIEKWKKESKKYLIVYLQHFADNDLRNQQELRWRSADIFGYNANSSNIHILQTSDLTASILTDWKYRQSTREIIQDAECILFVSDEEQVAKKDMANIDKFYKSLGVNYGGPFVDWTHKNAYILSVSATPFATETAIRKGADWYKSVSLETNDNYFSIENLRDSGRLEYINDVRLVVKGKITNFLKKQIELYLDDCDKYGNGYMLCRQCGTIDHTIAKYIQDWYPDCDFRSFTSRKPDGDSRELDEFISNPTSRPCIILVKGFLRAGKTLKTTEHIRRYICSADKDDTKGQDIGRYVGYPCSNGHLKSDDIFPILLKKGGIDEIINYYNGIGIPNGIRVKRTQTKINWEPQFFNTYEDVPDNIKYQSKSINSVSAGKENDIAKDIINNIPRETVIPGKRRLIKLDGPSPSFNNSWKLLMDKYPGKKGSYLWWVNAGKRETVGNLAKDEIHTKYIV